MLIEIKTYVYTLLARKFSGILKICESQYQVRTKVHCTQNELDNFLRIGERI